MSRPLFARAAASRDRASWHGAAFVLEVMVLVAFVAASLAVLAAVFSGAQMRGIDAIRLTDAVTLAASGASNGAEDFAADPEAAFEEGASTTYYAVAAGSVSACDPTASNACEVTRVVERHATELGALYDATITVMRDDEVLYELETSAYVSARANDVVSDAAASSDDATAPDAAAIPDSAAAPDAATSSDDAASGNVVISDAAPASDEAAASDTAAPADATASTLSLDEGGR